MATNWDDFLGDLQEGIDPDIFSGGSDGGFQWTDLFTGGDTGLGTLGDVLPWALPLLTRNSSFFQPDIPRVGYQGTVQKYDATRDMADNFSTQREPRFPGAYGQRYFSDVAFTPSGDADALAQAQQLTGDQARAIENANAARPAEIDPLLDLLNLRSTDNPYVNNLSAENDPRTAPGGSSDFRSFGTDISGLNQLRLQGLGGETSGGLSGGLTADQLALLAMILGVNNASGSGGTGDGTEPPTTPPTTPPATGTVDRSSEGALSLGGLPDVLGDGGTGRTVPTVKTVTPRSSHRDGAWVYGSDGQLRRRNDLTTAYRVDMGGGHYNTYESRADAEAALANLLGNNYAQGGLAGLKTNGRYLRGSTDGMGDLRPATIDGQQPAALSDGEFVVPADVVSHMGNGNSDAGARKLEEMMAKGEGEMPGSGTTM